jgi:hypothetical protein
MPAVADVALAGAGCQDLLAVGLIRVAPGTFQLRDPERIDLLTPAGRRRAVALAQGLPMRPYSARLRQARMDDSPGTTGTVSWLPSSLDLRPSLAQLRSRIKDQADIQPRSASICVRGSDRRIVRRVMAVILCDLLDASGQVRHAEAPDLSALVAPAPIRIDLRFPAAALGRDLPAEEVGAALRSYGYRVRRSRGQRAWVTPPLWRVDVSPADLMADLCDALLLSAPVSANWTAPAGDAAVGDIAATLTGLGYQEIPLRRATDIGLADTGQIRDRVRAWANSLSRGQPPRGFDLIPFLRPGRESTSIHLCLFGVTTRPDPNPMFSAIVALAQRFRADLAKSPAETGDLLAETAFTVNASPLFQGLFGLLPEPAANRWVSLAVLELLNRR